MANCFTAEFEVEHLEKQLSSADNKLIELESENETIKLQKNQMLERNQVRLIENMSRDM